MGWFSKLKAALGIARKIPQVDEAIEQLEERAEDLVEEAGPIGKIFTRLHLADIEHTSGEICVEAGEYVSVRDGRPVTVWGNRYDRVDLDAGDRFPPVIRKGDVWQRLV